MTWVTMEISVKTKASEMKVKTNVKIFPSLKEALGSLKRGECLYTNSWFMLVPIVVPYKEERDTIKGKFFTYLSPSPHEPSSGGVRTNEVLPELKGKVKYLGPTKKEDARIKIAREGDNEEKEISEIDRIYQLFFFRWDELNEFRKDLISSVEENRGVFKKSIEKATILGLKELDKYENKDIFSIGLVFIYPRLKDYIHKVIEEAMKPSPWKERLVHDSIVGEVRYNRLPPEALEGEKYEEIRRLGVNVWGGIGVEEESLNRIFSKAFLYYAKNWIKTLAIPIVDKELMNGETRRILGRVWEKENVFGIETNAVGENALDNAIKSREKSTLSNKEMEEIFPEVYGELSIELGLEGNEVELVAIPIGLEEVFSKPFKMKTIGDDGKEKVEVKRLVNMRYVRFLILLKTKVNKKYLTWSKVGGLSEYERFGFTTISRNKMFMKIKSLPEYGKEFFKELESSKRVIKINSIVSENIEISKDKERKRKPKEPNKSFEEEKESALELRNVSYSIYPLEVETYVMLKEREDGKFSIDREHRREILDGVKETIKVHIEKKGTSGDGEGCIDEKQTKSILEQIDKLISVFEEEKGKRKEKERELFIDLSLVLKKAKEILRTKEEETPLVKCVLSGDSVDLYSTITKIGIVEDIIEEIIKLKYENVPQKRGWIIPPPYRKGVESLCFRNGGIEKTIETSIKGEAYSEVLLNNILSYIGNKVLPTLPKELQEYKTEDRLSLNTTGLIISSLLSFGRRIPITLSIVGKDWINDAYLKIFKILSRKRFLVNNKEMIEKMAGIEISLGVSEYIKTRLRIKKDNNPISTEVETKIAINKLEILMRTNIENKILCLSFKDETNDEV